MLIVNNKKENEHKMGMECFLHCKNYSIVMRAAMRDYCGRPFDCTAPRHLAPGPVKEGDSKMLALVISEKYLSYLTNIES